VDPTRTVPKFKDAGKTTKAFRGPWLSNLTVEIVLIFRLAGASTITCFTFIFVGVAILAAIGTLIGVFLLSPAALVFL
jgi:hypothetical protein